MANNLKIEKKVAVISMLCEGSSVVQLSASQALTKTRL